MADTCHQCGGSPGQRFTIQRTHHPRAWFLCRDAFHDSDKQERLRELVKDHSKLVIVQECLRNEVEDTRRLRAEIVELKKYQQPPDRGPWGMLL